VSKVFGSLKTAAKPSLDVLSTPGGVLHHNSIPRCGERPNRALTGSARSRGGRRWSGVIERSTKMLAPFCRSVVAGVAVIAVNSDANQRAVPGPSQLPER